MISWYTDARGDRYAVRYDRYSSDLVLFANATRWLVIGPGIEHSGAANDADDAMEQAALMAMSIP